LGNKIVDQALALLNSTSEEDRQNSQELRLNMYLDNYEPEVTELLKSQFHPKNANRLYPMLATYYNLLKKIVDIQSILYNKSAVREWYKRNKNKDGSAILDESYSELMANSNIDITSQTINTLTNVNNTSFMRIIPDVENNIIKYSAVPSELIAVTQDPQDPTRINRLIHKVVIQDSYSKLANIASTQSSTRTEKISYISRYFYWDDENYIILDSDMKPMAQENNPENINPYGIIPYVLFTNTPSISGSIWNETVNSDLYKGTLQINVLQTYFNNALKLTAYRQPTITGIDSKEAEKLDHRVSDALQPIVVTSDKATIGTMDLSGGVTELKESIHDIISEIADNHGVSFNSRTTSAQKQSAAALSMEKEDIENLRQSQIPLYRASEKELAYKSIIIANQDLGYNIDIEGDFSIDFYEDEMAMDPKAKLEVDAFNLKSNLKSIVDLYIESDPDCPDEETAIKRLNKNKEINDSYSSSFDLIPVEGQVDVTTQGTN